MVEELIFLHVTFEFRIYVIRSYVIRRFLKNVEEEILGYH